MIATKSNTYVGVCSRAHEGGPRRCAPVPRPVRCSPRSHPSAWPPRRYAAASPQPRGPARPSAHGSARLRSQQLSLRCAAACPQLPFAASLLATTEMAWALTICPKSDQAPPRFGAGSSGALRVPGPARRVCSSRATSLHAARRPAESWSIASVPRPPRALLCSAASLMMSP